jgi:hypothetical protein
LCDVAEKCDGLTNNCPADVAAPAGTECRASVGGCDIAETCTGLAPVCPPDIKVAGGTTCRTSAGACDAAELCDGINGVCPADGKFPAGVECRGSLGACDAPEVCDGTTNACPNDQKIPSGTQCRVSAGACDGAETCDGVANDCPVDTKLTMGTLCRASKGICDQPETCDGVTDSCPSDTKSPVGILCRASADLCDQPETCDGVNDVCPNDSKLPAGTQCRASAGLCDLGETCDGLNNECPVDAKVQEGQVCRLPKGLCDEFEFCDGTGNDCPADQKTPAGVFCRAPKGLCDEPEACNGVSDACPADQLTPTGILCRPADGICDITEVCTGKSAQCPADKLVTAGVECRASQGTCDISESCDGQTADCPVDSRVGAGIPCRASGGECDALESCDGNDVNCPTDLPADDGTICSAGICAEGVCTELPPKIPEDYALYGGGPVCQTNPIGAASSNWSLAFLAVALGSLRRRFRAFETLNPRSSPPNQSSGKTDADARLASSLRLRSRSAFLALLAGFQDVDRKADGAFSRGCEQSVYPGLVTAILRFVVLLFAEARLVSLPALMPNILQALHLRLSSIRRGSSLDNSHDAWPFVIAAFQRMHESFRRSPEIGAAALFDPTTTAFLSAPLSNAVVLRVLDALRGRDATSIDFAELDLEHVGTFYEGLMAFDSLDSRVHYDISTQIDVRDAPSDERRRLGAHYTSRIITQIIMNRTLAPLFSSDDSPSALVDLRFCDPAMGSGAFVLEACRALAARLVDAWERTGEVNTVCPGQDPVLHAHRLVTEHCLYGVDKNPRAAELARWALWLLTASRHSYGILLDEHIRSGDSLIGRPGGQQWFSEGLPVKLKKRAVELLSRHRPFHWDVEFPLVMARGGFDAFVGNPPWVSYAGRAAQPLDADLRAYYVGNYPAFAGYRNLQGLFISRCASMLRPFGRLGLVLPSSMSELGGYAPTRLAHESLCECDLDLPDFGDVFDDVFQPSMALLSTRRQAPINIETPGLWPLHRSDLDDAGLKLLEHLAAFPTFPPELFGERGFQSMGDDVQQLHALEAPEGSICVGVRVGGDIDSFLRRRPKFYCDPTSFGSRFRAAAEWQNVMLLIRQTARFPIAALSDGQAFRNSILAGFSSETWSHFFLLAWLDSSPIRWYHYTKNRDARQGMPQVKITHLRSLPAPRSMLLVPQIEALGRTIGERNAGISLEEQMSLDTLVADALELGPTDRQIVRTWTTFMASK